jgi:hypothetical protein
MLLFVSLGWACEDTPVERVDELVEQADAAFRQLDAQGLSAAHTALMSELPCVSEPLTAELVAGVHQVEALARFAAGQPSTAAWRSTLAAWGAFQLDPVLAPEGHPLRMELDAARTLPEGDFEGLREGLLVDGREGHERALDRPVLVQDSRLSWYLLESQATPLELAPVVSDPPRRDRLAIGLSGAAVGTAVVAGGLYTGAWRTRAVYLDPATPYTELDALRARTNVLSTSSGVVGGLALGLAVGGGLAWTF